MDISPASASKADRLGNILLVIEEFRTSMRTLRKEFEGLTQRLESQLDRFEALKALSAEISEPDR